MPTMWKSDMTIDICKARKLWTEHYYKKGLRFGKLERVVDRKIRSKYAAYL